MWSKWIMEQRPHQQPAKVCIIHIAVAMGMLGWPEPREIAKTIAYGHLVEFFFFGPIKELISVTQF